MAVKNFVFRQNWVSRRAAGMKKNFFFAIFDPNKEFLKQHFSYERQKLYYYQFCDFKTD